MIIKILFKHNKIKFNDDDIEAIINNANSVDEIDKISADFSAFLSSFNKKITGFVNLINNQRELINSNSMNKGSKGKVPTMTPPSGVGVRRVTHSNSQINYDNQGFIRVKALIICSVIVTLVMYGILLVANLK